MKLKSNISFQTLVNLLQLDAEVKYSSLDSYPLKLIKGMPSNLYHIPFSTFAKSVRYADNILNSVEFLHRLTGVDNIGLMKAVKIYPIYTNYLKQVNDIMTMFRKLDSEVPSQKQRVVKTMEEFGMSNIIDRISEERPELHDYLYAKSVDWIYIEYRRKIHKLINTIANQKRD